MGMGRDADISCWQQAAGVVPATGEYANALRRLSDAAFDLIKIIELEISGIRDGGGYWYCSDGLGGMWGEVLALIAEVKAERDKFDL
jgi:hypothetical protein